MVACNVVGVLIGDGGGFVLGSDDESLSIDDSVVLGFDDESLGTDDGASLGFNDELRGIDDNVVGSDDGYDDGLSFGTNGGILDDSNTWI